MYDYSALDSGAVANDFGGSAQQQDNVFKQAKCLKVVFMYKFQVICKGGISQGFFLTGAMGCV